jgi:hypothetical protein
MTLATARAKPGPAAFRKNPAENVNLRPGATLFKMSATTQSRPAANDIEGKMASIRVNIGGWLTPAMAQTDCLRSPLTIDPPRP